MSSIRRASSVVFSGAVTAWRVGDNCGKEASMTRSAISAILPPGLPKEALRCDQRFDRQREFYVQSPNYPSHYLDNQDCRYVITKAGEDVCHLELVFASFDIESSPGCQYDYLEFGGQRHCGSLPADHSYVIPFLGSDMVLHFHSNVATTRRGFSVRARQIKCALGTSPAAPPPSQLPGPPGSSHPDYGAGDGKSQGVVVTTTTPVRITTPYGPGSVSSTTGEPYITRRSCDVYMNKATTSAGRYIACRTSSRKDYGRRRMEQEKLQAQAPTQGEPQVTKSAPIEENRGRARDATSDQAGQQSRERSSSRPGRRSSSWSGGGRQQTPAKGPADQSRGPANQGRGPGLPPRDPKDPWGKKKKENILSVSFDSKGSQAEKEEISLLKKEIQEQKKANMRLERLLRETQNQLIELKTEKGPAEAPKKCNTQITPAPVPASSGPEEEIMNVDFTRQPPS
ncbi:hypothetical protein HPB49_000227 [Dermacentor silvarum]|uniref:Uncharacterized protein n=1 Tax=Dermacentor silvarum TaxID=543639 RepID=A0ACB8DRN5_DERSI|nr:hypothetical protein HPB49_000227 [Dermacentor silvarum]